MVDIEGLDRPVPNPEKNSPQSLRNRLDDGTKELPISQEGKIVFSRRTLLRGTLGGLGLLVASSLPTTPEFIPQFLKGVIGNQEARADGGIETTAVTPDFDLIFIRQSSSNPNLGYTDSAMGGHFYQQTRGEASFPTGYAVLNTFVEGVRIPMWDIYQRYSQVRGMGYPVSWMWTEKTDQGLTVAYQGFEKTVLKITVDDQGQVLDHQTGDIPIPPQVAQPDYVDNLKLPEGIVDLILNGKGAGLSVWEAEAQAQNMPLWQLILKVQEEHVLRTGRSLPLPGVPEVEKWDQWAKEANLSTPEFLLKAFYTDLPLTLITPLEEQALSEVNKQRTARNLSPLVLHPEAIKAARVQAAYVLINKKERNMLHKRGVNFSAHQQFPGTVGFIGEWPTDRVRYFKPEMSDMRIGFGENLGAGSNPVLATKGFMDSPPHKALILSPTNRFMGYAQPSMLWRIQEIQPSFPKPEEIVLYYNNIMVIGDIPSAPLLQLRRFRVWLPTTPTLTD